MLSSGFVKKVYEKIEDLGQDALRDFTDKLFEEREFFHLIFDSMAEGVLVADSTHKIQYSNRTAELLLGKQSGSLINISALGCTQCTEFNKFLKYALIDNEKIRNKEVYLEAKTQRVLNINIFPIFKDTDLKGNIIMFMDISREKSEQSRLRRAESMAALSTITAGIAHEIKNPLGAIDIQLQLIERIMGNSKNEENLKVGKYVKTVREEVDRLNTIVVDFLNAIRPLKVELKKMSINTVINDLFRLIEPETKERKIQLMLNLNKGITEIPLDSKLIKQALLNIVNNSIEAVGEDGKIVISTSADNDWLYISVADNGRGIEKDKIDSLFEPYYTTKHFGTGLGLTIVYKIVKEHRGDIEIETQDDRGTNFIIKLPVLPEANPQMIDFKE